MHLLIREVVVDVSWVHTTHSSMLLVDSPVSCKYTHAIQDTNHGARPKTHEDMIAYSKWPLEMV